MDELGVIEIVIILSIVAVKFAVIIGTVLYVQRRNQKKRQRFLDEQARNRMASTVNIDAGNQ